MDGIKFYSRGMSLYSELFQDSDLSFCSKRKTIGQSVYNVHEALAEKYFIKKEAWTGTKLIGEISHINTDLDLNPSLYYYPFYSKEGSNIYHLGKGLKLEIQDKDKWIKFLIDKKNMEFYDDFYLSLPNKYFLEKQEKDRDHLI